MTPVSDRTASTGQAPSGQQAPAGTPRLGYLDGIRGMAAAMVVVSHLPAFAVVPAWIAALGLGNPWVAIFITLSGFCLYLPSAGRARVEMPRPFWEFMRRRARRIVPAWYASLALCMVVGWFFAATHHPSRFGFLPMNWQDIVTHLALLHSATRYSGSINGPGYTLGTEWQLYILMILFLAVAVRIGWGGLVIAAALLALPWPGLAGSVIHKVFSSTFTVPFIIGMAAVRLVRRPPAWLDRLRPSTAALLLASVAAAAAAAYLLINRLNHDAACWAAALATGSVCVLLGRRPGCLPDRLLSSAAGRTLGGFSYSLYLTHFPLLALTAYCVGAWGIPAEAAFGRVFVPALPLIFGFAYLFHLAFERPFLNSRLSTAAPVLPRLHAASPQEGIHG